MSSAILINACTEVPTANVTNQLPETHLSLVPDSVISPQKTRLKIVWWGDDPDGLISGFRISFDSLNWTFTTKNDSTFLLEIHGQDSTFRFWAASVDDKGGIDPTPATNLYPVRNSNPDVTFNTGSEIPDTSFTVATFAWTGIDPDGNSTIRYYHWALNDTSNWHTIAGNINLFTIRQDSGIVVNSNNIFYLKAEDIAGAYSPVRRMPDSAHHWFVREPVGNILLLDDYPSSILDNGQAALFYQNALTGHTYSKLDIKVNGGSNVPKIKNPMFTETLKLFSCIIWYAGRGNGVNDNANFELAQQTLPYYLAAGGKIFFTTGFPNAIESQGNIVNFAPVDSVTLYQLTNMDPDIPVLIYNNSYDTLFSGPVVPDRVRGIYPRLGSNVIYKIPYRTSYPPNDTLTICVKDAANNPHIVFMSVPLHRMNNRDNAGDFLRYVIETDFGIR